MTLRRTLVVLVAATLATTAALAHTKLKSSVPAADAALAQPIAEIVLEFVEPVQLTAVTLTSGTGAGQELAALPRERAAQFAIGIRTPLAPGDYVIAWRAVGADTHLVSGDIPFTVSPAAHGH